MGHSGSRNSTQSFDKVVDQQLQCHNDANVQKAGLEPDEKAFHATLRHENIMNNVPRPPSIVLVRIHQTKDHVAGLARNAGKDAGDGGSDN